MLTTSKYGAGVMAAGTGSYTGFLLGKKKKYKYFIFLEKCN